MEHQLYQQIVALLKELDKSRTRREGDYPDWRIAAVYYWSVLFDRPMRWACEACNWPIWLRRERLPSPSRMSVRLRTKSVQALLARLEDRVVRRPDHQGVVWLIDGKPLTISGVSQDRQAGYGRAARSKAKGYKIHVLCGNDKSLAEWRLAPMNVDERKIARRMLRSAKVQGYVMADANYDSNELHSVCDKRGNLQLVSPRRYGPGRGHGHRKQTAGRLRSKAILEDPFPQFGQALLAQRGDIERHFGNWTGWGGGLTHLPPWVRTYRRVHRWVQAKIILNYVKRPLEITTYVEKRN